MPERAETDRGIRTGVIAAILAALGLMVAVVGGAVHLLANGWETPMSGANAPMDMRIAGPHLQSAPQYDRARYFAEKDELLERYEWIDRKKGVARIPIEVAMKLVLKNAATANPQRDKVKAAAGAAP